MLTISSRGPGNHGARRALLTRSVSEVESLPRPRLRFGLVWRRIILASADTRHRRENAAGSRVYMGRELFLGYEAVIQDAGPVHFFRFQP
jgi:hypothetical protein